MAGRKPSNQDEDNSKRLERANRILDAALELLQRWGYKKTTLDDIARQAGVAKGTLYLHWRTRERLFETLMLREWLKMLQAVRQYLEINPTSVTLSHFTRYVGQIAIANPLIKAALLRDNEMLGYLAHSTTGQGLIEARLKMGIAYLQLLRERNLVRTGETLEMQLKMLSAIATGYFIVDQFLPSGYRFQPEELVEQLAETFHRTFEPEQVPEPQALADVGQELIHMLDRLINLVESKYQI